MRQIHPEIVGACHVQYNSRRNGESVQLIRLLTTRKICKHRAGELLKKTSCTLFPT